MNVVVVADMAWESKRDSDFTVILPAIMTPSADVLVDSYIKKRGMRPNEFEEIIFGMNIYPQQHHYLLLILPNKVSQ